MFRFPVLATVPLIALAACSNTGFNYTPIIDGPVTPNYSGDLAACQNLAASNPTLGAEDTATIATAAGVAAAVTAIAENKGNNVLDATIIGGLVGAAGAGLENTQQQESIVRNCMRGRGYNVVG
ncbi:MAG: glycine zipper family protein [Rhodobacteraceae bacterium]|nr:glycine zipper family protein [Paracoccaceae bacterium]